MVEWVWRRQNDLSAGGSIDAPLPHRETENESYRLQHSTLADQAKIRTRERKLKEDDVAEDDEAFRS